MNVSVLFSTMMELFSMILIGFYSGKKNYIHTNQNQALSFLVCHVFFPCMVIASVYSKTGNNDGIVEEALIAGLCFYLFLIGFSWLLFKIMSIKNENIYIMSFLKLFECPFLCSF